MKKLNQTKANRVFTDLFIRNEEDKVKAINVLDISGGTDIWYTTFSKDAITKGMHSWYIDKDLAAAKQWFYVAGKSIAISTTKPVGYAKLWTCHDFMFPMLSDNLELIQQFASVSPIGFTEKCENPKEGEFQGNLVQTAIKQDDVKLKQLVSLLPKKGFNEHYVNFYTGLIEADIPKMESALAFLGDFKSQNPTTEDFLAFHAVVMCKLAWLRGYEVQVDSQLVPMAFMPVSPLADYDDVYEFLKPGWQAPPQPEPASEKKGLLGKLFGK